MIVGIVTTELATVIRLAIVDPQGGNHEVEAAIDTGFNGFLALPKVFLSSNGCPRVGQIVATLADGREELFDLYEVVVDWDGQRRRIDAFAVDSDPLVGMSLLVGYDLHIEVASGGRVTIQPSAPSASP